MNDYVLCGGSTVDLTCEYLKERNIEWIGFHFSIDDKEFVDDMGVNLSSADFYQAMRDGGETKTWQLNSEDYCEFFRPFLSDGKDIVYVCLSSGLSGTYNSACLAADELTDEFPDRKIYVIDSLGASSGYGLLVDALADMRDNGATAEELYTEANNMRLNVHHWFFSTDLTFYIKGGRVSKTSGMVGTLLGICPLLNMNTEGKLIPRQKVRTKRKVIAEVVKKMEEHADGGLDYKGKCFISHSDCAEDAKTVRAMVKERFPNINGEIKIFNIGPTIGCHSGPGTVALFFFGDDRTI